MDVQIARERQNGCRMKQNGGALLWVIILVIVVIGVVTIGQKFFGWGSPGDPEECPWLEADRIVGFGGSVALPTPPKAELKIWNSFRVDPVHEGQKRGSLQVEIAEDGLVTGTWKAEYKESQKTYTYNASFEGNVDVTKTFADENGNEDPSLLYVIAQGRYMKQVYSPSSPSGVGGGEAYLTGWLGPDGKGHGKIILAFDKKVTLTLTWEK